MPNSKYFESLQKRLSVLRRHLLPMNFSPTGIYSDIQLDRARAYRLLVHAEIEYYLEEIARDTVKRKISEWKRLRKASDLLVCFLACYHSGWSGDDEEVKPLPPKSRTKVKEAAEEAVELAMTQYINILGDNHGIQLRNFKRIILPLGVRLDDLDDTWLTSLDDYGKKRGEIAHMTVGVTKTIDPKTEYDNVKALLNGLKTLDDKIINLTS